MVIETFLLVLEEPTGLLPKETIPKLAGSLKVDHAHGLFLRVDFLLLMD